jgi:hypothetical protein
VEIIEVKLEPSPATVFEPEVSSQDNSSQEPARNSTRSRRKVKQEKVEKVEEATTRKRVSK